MEKELEDMQKFYDLIIEFFVNYRFQIIGAIIILIIGYFVAKKVASFVEKFCLKKNMDETLTRFIALGIRIAIIAGVAIIALGKLGITITPFVAAIGALSLGAGLALQGLLSNFGAGISIIATRPFIVGNTITIQGQTGVVKIIKLAYTVLETEDKDENNSLVDNEFDITGDKKKKNDQIIKLEGELSNLKTSDNKQIDLPGFLVECPRSACEILNFNSFSIKDLFFFIKYEL